MGEKRLTMMDGTSDERVTFDFRGAEFEASRTAFLSARVQRGLAVAGDMAPASQRMAYEAMDAVCCGRLDEYMGRIPEEDGALGPYGCSNEAFGAFMAAAGEAISKN